MVDAVAVGGYRRPDIPDRISDSSRMLRASADLFHPSWLLRVEHTVYDGCTDRHHPRFLRKGEVGSSTPEAAQRVRLQTHTGLPPCRIPLKPM
jgi:hypothetical protein